MARKQGTTRESEEFRRASPTASRFGIYPEVFLSGSEDVLISIRLSHRNHSAAVVWVEGWPLRLLPHRQPFVSLLAEAQALRKWDSRKARNGRRQALPSL